LSSKCNCVSATYKQAADYQEEDHDSHWAARISKTDYIYSSIPRARPFHQNDREDWQQSTWWYDGLPCSFISWPPRSEDRPLISQNDQSPLWFSDYWLSIQ